MKQKEKFGDLFLEKKLVFFQRTGLTENQIQTETVDNTDEGQANKINPILTEENIAREIGKQIENVDSAAQSCLGSIGRVGAGVAGIDAAAWALGKGAPI